MMRTVKTAVIRSAGPLGLYATAWKLTRHRPRIFMYHRFSDRKVAHKLDQEAFRAQIRMIKKKCSVVTMSELTHMLKNEPHRASELAVITVDDGYRDFYEQGWPILREEAVPATFFPVTGFVDRETWLWPDVVDFGLSNTSERSVSLNGLGVAGGSAEPYSLGDKSQRRAVWQGLIDYAIDLPDDEKWAFLREYLSRLELEWPDEIPEQYAPATWGEIREMSDAGIEIGAHTKTHCRLTRVDDGQLEEELLGARLRLESQIGREVVSLCYPNGAPADYDQRVIDCVKASGYSAAVTAFFDGNRGGIYDLRRHNGGGDMYSFRKSLAGVDELSRKLLSSQ